MSNILKRTNKKFLCVLLSMLLVVGLLPVSGISVINTSVACAQETEQDAQDTQQECNQQQNSEAEQSGNEELSTDDQDSSSQNNQIVLSDDNGNYATINNATTNDNSDDATDDNINTPNDISLDKTLKFYSANALSIACTNKLWTGTIYYNINNSGWNTWDGSEIVAPQPQSGGETAIYMYGVGNTTVTGQSYTTAPWTINGSQIYCLGNMESLLDYEKAASGAHPTMDAGCFSDFFNGCSELVQAPTLGSVELSIRCYAGMFADCSQLEAAPELPATKAVESCYQEMFAGCTKLVVPPSLPAGTSAGQLAKSCYDNMFQGCESLIVAPALQASKLADNCYTCMFRGCSSLEATPDLPAEILATNCYQSMFEDCVKICIPADLSHVKEIYSGCCARMYYGCSDLKVYTEPTGVFSGQWIVNPDNTYDSWSKDMFGATSGSFTGSPDIKTSYYVYSDDGDFITFYSNSPFTLKCVDPGWDGTIQYSHDASNWTKWNGGHETISGEQAGTSKYVLFVRGYSNTKICKQGTDESNNKWSIEGEYVYSKGNIETLLSHEAVENEENVELSSYCFSYLFYQNTCLITLPDLPSTNLAEGCYHNMFRDCTSVLSMPELSATTMQPYCYQNMFRGCVSLLSVHKFEIVTLAKGCYRGMFSYCTSIEDAPDLPSPTLAEECYANMFEGCTNLTCPGSLASQVTLATDCCKEMYKKATSLVVKCNRELAYNDIWEVNSPSSSAISWSKDMFVETASDPNAVTPATGTRYYICKKYANYIVLDSKNEFKLNIAEKTWNGNLMYSSGITTAGKEQWIELNAQQEVKSLVSSSGTYEVKIKGSGNSVITGLNSSGWSITSDGEVACTGNIMTLLDSEKASQTWEPITMDTGCFKNMFKDCTCLTYAPDLTTYYLSDYCYQSMFEGCTSLKYAPLLRAYSLTTGCYSSMFKNCDTLEFFYDYTGAALVDNCYESAFEGCDNLTHIYMTFYSLSTTAKESCKNMFKDCSLLQDLVTLDASFNYTAEGLFSSMYENCASLQHASDLNVNSLEKDCCMNMYKGCTSLLTGPTITTKAFKESCLKGAFYGCSKLQTMANVSGPKLENYCFAEMYKNCSSLIKVENLEYDQLADYCYQSMFENCSMLRKPCALPATELKTHCYESMFKNCTGISSAPAEFSQVTVVADSCCKDMYNGCSSMKIFERPAGYYDQTWIATSITKTEQDWAQDMFTGTIGEFRGTPNIGSTYYVYSTNKLYLTFSSPKAFTLSKGSYTSDMHFEYSYDGQVWNEWTRGENSNWQTLTPQINQYKNYAVYLRGYNNTYLSFKRGDRFLIEGSDVSCDGNIETLMDYKLVAQGIDPFYNTYGSCAWLFSVPDAYSDCPLISSPELPTLNLHEDCYSYMFANQQNLKTCPALPASSLPKGCYTGMFMYCMSLTIPASLSHVTSISYDCCGGMYNECSNISVYTSKSAEHAREWKATQCSYDPTYWSRFMFDGDESTTVRTPKAGQTYYIKTTITPDNFITFAAQSTFYINFATNKTKTWDGKLYYSYDRDTWEEYQAGTELSCYRNSEGEYCLYFCGEGNTVISNTDNAGWSIIGQESGLGNVYCAGNIESLLDYKTVSEGSHPTMNDGCFKGMFSSLSESGKKNQICSAPKLPNENLTKECYKNMFSGCSWLKSAPELPATTLKEGCYEGMFKECLSLSTPPELPSTYTRVNCYKNMFNGSGITTAPKLTTKKTAANDGCYEGMFANTSKLTTAPDINQSSFQSRACYGMFEGSAITKVPVFSIASTNPNSLVRMFADCASLTDLPENIFANSTIEENAFESMFEGCTSLINVPGMAAKQVNAYGCKNMFKSCTALKKCPELPATTLAEYAYTGMFSECSSLLEPCNLPATELKTGVYSNMFADCTNLKTIEDMKHVGEVVQNSCQEMYLNCSNIKLSYADEPSAFPECARWYAPNCKLAYSESWSTDMFKGTSGEIKGSVKTDFIYLLDKPDVYSLLYKTASSEQYSLVFQNDDSVDTSMGQCVGKYKNPFVETATSGSVYPWYDYREKITSATFRDTVCTSCLDYVFEGFINCKTIDISKINFSNASHAYGIFKNCTSLEKLDLSGFDTSSILESPSDRNIFENCTNLSEIKVGSKWSYCGYHGSQADRLKGLYFPPRTASPYYYAQWLGIEGPDTVKGKIFASSETMPDNVEATFAWDPVEEVKAEYFDFKAEEVTYNGQGHSASVTIKERYKQVVGKITAIKYYKDGSSEPIAEGQQPTDAGVYQVKISGEGGNNYAPYTDLTESSWTLSINKRLLDKDASTIEITQDPETICYTGDPIVPTFKVVDKTLGEEGTEVALNDLLVEGHDNTNASYEGSKAYLSVYGQNNYYSNSPLYVDFTINKGKNVISDFTCKEQLAYGVDSPNPSANSKFGKTEFAYSKYYYTNYESKWNLSNEPGKYYCKAYVESSELHNYDYVEQIKEITVVGKAIDVEAKALDATYNSQLQTLGEVKVNSPTSYTIKYSDKDYGDYYLDDMPQFSAAGKHNIRFMITASGYDTYYGKIEATIAQKDLSASGFTATSRVFNYETGVDINVGAATLGGVETADVGKVTIESASGNMETASAGTNKNVVISDVVLIGDAATNYKCTNVESIKVDIAKATPWLYARPEKQNYSVGTEGLFTLWTDSDAAKDDFSFTFDKTIFSTIETEGEIEEGRQKVTVTAIKAGETATITANMAATDNFNSASITQTATTVAGDLKINENIPQITYNGEAQELGSVKVVGPQEAITKAVVTYTLDGETSTTPIKKTNAGTYNVGYKVECEGYTTIERSFTSKIDQATNQITSFTCASFDYDESKSPQPELQAKFGESTATFAYSTSETGPWSSWVSTNPPGTYYVKATIAETTNYTAAESVTSFKVNALKFKDVKFEASKDLIYTGSAKVLGKITTSTESPTIQYKIGQTSTYSSEEPKGTDAGKYEVWYKLTKTGYETIEDYAVITIAKADNSFTTFKCDNVDFKVQPQPEAVPKFGDKANVKFSYSTSESGTFTDWDINNPVGKYYVKAFIAGDGKNYNDYSQVISFEVTEATIHYEKHPAYGLSYNAALQKLGYVSTTEEGCVVKYKYGKQEYSTDLPMAMEASVYNVYFTIEKDGYKKIEGDYFTTEIWKAKNEITSIKCDDINYKSSPNPSGSAKFGEVKYLYASKGSTEFAEWSTESPAGDYTCKAYVEGTSNYESCEDTTPFVVKKLDIGVQTFPAQNLKYTGEAQNLGYIVTSPDDCTKVYRLDTTSEYTSEPKATDAKTYTVYYKATKDNYNEITGSFEVTIKKADPILDLPQSPSYQESSTQIIDTNYNGDGVLNAQSSNPDVVSVIVRGKQLELQTYTVQDSAIITVSTSESKNFNEVTKIFTVTVVHREYYEVSFETFGGTEIATQQVKCNEKVVQPDDPKLSGNTFKNWISLATYPDPYDFNTPVNSDFTLYANYEVGEIICPEGDKDIVIDKAGLQSVMAKLKTDNPDADSIILNMSYDKWNINDSDKAVLDANVNGKKYVGHEMYLTAQIDEGEIIDYGKQNDIIIPVTYAIDQQDKENFVACRVHDGVYGAFSSQPGESGEYATIDKESGTVKVFAKKFSAYAFAYNEVVKPTPEPEPVVPGSDDVINYLNGLVASGDSMAGMLVAIIVVFMCASVGVICIRRKRKQK